MNEDVLNGSIRKFLKTVGVTSQREIEKAVRAAVSSGKIKGNETLPAKVVLTVGGVALSWTVASTSAPSRTPASNGSCTKDRNASEKSGRW